MDKRAISPLFATFILIISAIVIGIVIMSWGRGYVEREARFADEGFYLKAQCDIDPGLDKIKVSKEAINYSLNEGFIDVFVDYDIGVQGKEFKLVIEGDKGIDTIEMDNFSFGLSYPAHFRVVYNPDLGEIKEIGS